VESPDQPDVRDLDDSEVARVCEFLGLARLDQGDGRYLVAWIGDVPVGHAYLTRTNPPNLQDVEVDEAYRRRGVARRLLDVVHSAALAQGARSIVLSVSARSLDAQSLYRSLGFEDTGTPPLEVRGTVQIRSGPIEVDDTLLTWEKKLAAPGEP
jgi:GNAT superfamily N-acetyltransferase